ncbi:MAG TPA: IS110 family transposase [Bellilinea sp.]|nr:IS110 family transposase [Bellilinea sp.]
MISVGIDVSKEKSMVCILKPYGEVVLSPIEIMHTEEAVTKLADRILELGSEVRVVLEATGAYHLPLLSVFMEKNIFVSIINPLVMKKYASTSIRKGKTDKIDSVRIANYGLDNWFHLRKHQPTEDVYEELKFLGRQYSHYIRMKIESKLSLNGILDRTMPGIKKLLSGKRSDYPTKDKLSDFVEHYWHYDIITKLSEEEFIKSYQEWAKKKKYHASESKARKIYAMASSGIPTLSSSTPSTKMLVLESVRVLGEINKTLQNILTQLQATASTLKEYETVRAMSGVGDVLAPRLIAEIGDVKRFHSASALVAYAGLDSPPYESGNFVGTRRKISKRGSSLLRKTGYEVMKCLKTIQPEKDAAVYLYMMKKEAEGKAKKVAKIAALNKFLRIYYARVMELQ